MEKIYDEKVAPLLLEAANICKQYNMPFAAVVEYSQGDFGETSALLESCGIAMRVVGWAIKCKGNFDALVLAAMRWGKDHPHNSAVLHILEGKHS